MHGVLPTYSCLHPERSCHSPGHFFAANELKIMLACMVVKFDVKFSDNGKKPENEWLAYTCYPARHAQVLFKKRRSTSA